jgi:23S rRNA (uracil1939-C5)-methyltransferase
MRPKIIIPFKITAMDPLGQGVSKETDKITFIPKTLPGEQGTAEVMAQRKGVAFARGITFTQKSPLRQDSPCPHFNSCPSCHYLHTNYETEINFKKESLEKLFYKLPHPDLQVVPAIQRLGYRNRIQLHYDLTTKTLGMMDMKANRILPIPQCLIGTSEVLSELQRLYHQNTWLAEAPPRPLQGHVEIYFHQGQLKTSWNRPYAEGGFSQVYDEMNQQLKALLLDWYQQATPQVILDLFAGQGNLSEHLEGSQRLCVDLYQQAPGDEFLSQNLYEDKAIDRITGELTIRQLRPEFLLLDPPRSGCKDLASWVERLQPARIAYVSCDPHTLVRDLASLQGYEIQDLYLIDFFPSTFHFETMVFLQRKD